MSKIPHVTARFQVSQVKHCKNVKMKEVAERTFVADLDGNGDKILETTAVEVSLHPVYTPDPENPNYAFSCSTPSGRMEMSITNSNLFDWYKPGDVVDIVMTPHVKSN